ncbi:DUF6932 family protein [Bradyrhizobium sp. USDA 3364]
MKQRRVIIPGASFRSGAIKMLAKIPANTISGILPPFTGETPADGAFVSPYEVKISDVVTRYGTSLERTKILTGLLNYRKALKDLGIVSGFQWLDGSFVEDVETIRNRPPGDIDLVTFAHRPVQEIDEWQKMLDANQHVFVPRLAKAQFKCDAYFVDLSIDPAVLVADTTYWFGLFSHQRDVAAWKGMLRVDLESDDTLAEAML